jgi:choline dehydrogenase
MQPTSGMNVTGDFNPAIHGYDGPIRVSLPNDFQKIFDVKFFQAADELGGIFNYNVDMNSGNPLGSSGCFKCLSYYMLNELKLST